jgi:hypothetical protein
MGISRMQQSDARSADAPLGELLGDVAGHAQGIIRTELQLAFAQVRQELHGAARRVAIQAGAIGFGLVGAIGLLIAGALALTAVVTAWLAVLITAGVALLIAVAMFAAASRGST